MLLTLVFVASYQGVVLGTSERASTIVISRMTKVRAERLAMSSMNVVLTDVLAPRTLQRRAGAAQWYIRELSLGELVTVEEHKPSEILANAVAEEDAGTFGRIRLGKVWLHEALVRAGHAWVLPHARKDAALVVLEDEARAAKRGLWADADPLEPWLWRELTLLTDAENKHVHSGWECPWVQKTQCKPSCGRAYSLEEAKTQGFLPHATCMTPELLRIASATGELDAGADPEAPPVYQPSARRECTKDADCAIAPLTPCSCSGCGAVWHDVARREIVQRMKANFARATCAPPGCPACAGQLVGTRAVCKERQCTIE